MIRKTDLPKDASGYKRDATYIYRWILKKDDMTLLESQREIKINNREGVRTFVSRLKLAR